MFHVLPLNRTVKVNKIKKIKSHISMFEWSSSVIIGGKGNSYWCRIVYCKLLTFILLFPSSSSVIIVWEEGEIHC